MLASKTALGGDLTGKCVGRRHLHCLWYKFGKMTQTKVVRTGEGTTLSCLSEADGVVEAMDKGKGTKVQGRKQGVDLPRRILLGWRIENAIPGMNSE